MTRIPTLLPAMALLALLAAPAAAVPVSYTTAGTFTGDGNTDNVFEASSGGVTVTISYSGQSPTLVDSPAVGDLGGFDINIVGEGTVSFSGTFDLTIFQTAPSDGSDTLSEITLTGIDVGATSVDGILAPTGVVTLAFADTSAVIGDTTYDLVLPQPSAPTLFLDITGDPTRPSAFIDGTIGGGEIIPEPASMVMAGLGLAALAGLGLRQRRRGA